ncbi:MAG: helix-turn-helix domain-containing protein [Candidatus Portnoybacteria bacterium]|nr:helix-turn-helix domain-containing protein [Candidatus Portnoybacteria bacterium]MDD5437641.1 helix-turn-helix domain-containing protein [Patescibacteria group bacterium]
MTIAQIIEKLAEIGLTENQITVYLELIRAKKCRANLIIKNTKLHRSIVYTCLDDLLNKGLASKLTQNGVAIFEATNPKNLIELMETKRRTAETVAENLSKIMEQAPRDIRLYEGAEGIVQARERSLNLPADETIYVLGGSSSSSTPAFEALWLPYHKKRIKQGIKSKILFDRTVPTDYLDTRNSMPLTQAKYLPFKQDMPAWFEAYGQTFVVNVPAHEPVVFSMHSPEASEALKNFFEYLWNQNVTVENGTEALRKSMFEILDELKPGESYSVLGAAFGMMGKEAVDLYGEYHKQRVKKGVKLRMLAYTESIDQIKKLFADAGDPDGKLSSIKPLTTSPKNPTQIYIYGNKVCMAIMGEVPTIIHFDQPGLHESFQAHFDYLWDQESYILKGPKALQEIFLEAVEAKELRYIGARGYFMDQYPNLFKPVLEKIKVTPGVRWRNIVDPGVRGHGITRFPWTQTKYTLSMAKNPNVVWLYGKKVVVTSWAGDEPVMFMSTNPQLVQSYNDYFEELWSHA